MKREEMMLQKKEVKKYILKPYEQMTHHGERIKIDMKVVPRRCFADTSFKLYQYAKISLSFASFSIKILCVDVCVMMLNREGA